MPEYWERIEAVSVTAIRATTLCVDRDGNPLRPAFVWLDNRKAEGKPKYSQLTRLMLKAVGMDQTAILQYRKGQCNWMMERSPRPGRRHIST